MTVADFKNWWAWLDTFDPTTAKIIDLYHFAGLSLEETAAATQLPPATVMEKLHRSSARPPAADETV